MALITGIRLCLLTFLPLFSLSTDTLLLNIRPSDTNSISWVRHDEDPVNTRNIIFVNEDSILERAAIQITNDSRMRDGPSMEGRVPFSRDSWQRFYLRLEPDDSGSFSGQSRCAPVAYSFSPWVEKERPSTAVTFCIYNPKKHGEPFTLVCRLRPSVLPEQQKQEQVAIQAHRRYCVESRLTFTNQDSLKLEWYLDGTLVWKTKCHYAFPKDFIGLTITKDCFATEGGFKNRVYLDNLAISPNRIPPIPVRPIAAGDSVCNALVFLNCAPFVSSYAGERITAVRFRLFAASNPSRPLYDRICLDPNFFSHFKLPFEPDSGGYSWQASSKNQYEQWSSFSPLKSFKINYQQPHETRLEQLYLTKRNGKDPITQITSNQWYDVHLQFDHLPSDTQNQGYALVWFSHESFTEGDRTNKGGPFIAKRNYVFNLSFYCTKESDLTLFEKSTEGSLETRVIEANKEGLYSNGKIGQTKIDLAKKEIRLRVKLLPQAMPGTWYVSGILVTPVEQFSNQLSFPITLKSSNQNTKYSWLAGIAATFFLGIMIVMRFKKSPKPLPASQVTQANPYLVKYIEEHISEKLSVDKIKQDLRINRQVFYRMLKDGGFESLPQLVNNIKIERSKQLLSSTNLTIDEISYQLGFEHPKYFSRLFKTHTQSTPTDFRRSVHTDKDPIR